MSVLSALKVAIEVAERKRDTARQTLLDLEHIAQSGQAQLQQLSGYAQETQQRWGAREGAQLKPEVLYHHYQFQGKLDHAIHLQNQTVETQAQRVAQGRHMLLQAELRVQSLKKMQARKQQELLTAQARRDQKQTDERAMLRHVNAYQSQSPSGQED